MLHDLLVLELASVLAGPSVGQFLAELGARVVKVENLRTGGDVTRRWRLAEEAAGGHPSAYFACCNWGKESLALDLKKPEGRALVHQLAEQADVVLASYRPGAAARLGVDAATLRALNPRLIYAQVTGYGEGDERAGYDAVIQAESGYMHLNGAPDGPPTKLPVALMDVLAGHQLKQAVLLALLARTQTGEGQVVSVSLMAAAVSGLVNQATNWLVAGVAPQRMGSAHPNIAPYGTPYAVADGAVVLAVGTDAQFARLCAVLAQPERAQDPRFASNAARVQHRTVLDAWLAPALARWQQGELLTALHEQAIPAGAIRSVDQVFAQAAGQELRLHTATATGLRQAVFAVPPALDPPPALGSDSAAVLRELLGLDEGAVQRLAAAGVIAG